MLCVNNLSKSFFGRTVLNNITYNFPLSKIIALIGANGAGKSTFLNMLCGLEKPDDGTVSKAKSANIGYLPQEPNPNPAENIIIECMMGNDKLYNLMQEFNKASILLGEEYTNERYENFERLEELYRNEGGYSFEYDASNLLKGLGFKEEQFQNSPTSLSGGWRMRLELAKLLIKEPEFLVLDEPTNHLDLPTINWLEGYLKKFKGTVLFVSHDESLLRSLPNMVLHLKNSVLNEYHGNYDDFLEQYELREMGKMAELKSIQSKIDSASRFVERFKAKATKAAQAQSRMKMIAKLQEEASSINLDSADAEINIRVPLTQKSGKEVIFFEQTTIGYTKPLMRNLNFCIQRGQKVAIVGANGLGKSTLLKSVIGEIPLLKGEIRQGHNVKISYYAQDQHESLDMNKTVFSNLQDANSKMQEIMVRKLLGSFLFKGDDIYKQVSVLSGGEKSRLSLACLLVQDANVLLLDEPTNHLDMLSSEILSDALSSFEGTLMMVSHNRSFINNVATHILAVSTKGEVYMHEGKLETLEEKWIL